MVSNRKGRGIEETYVEEIEELTTAMNETIAKQRPVDVGFEVK